MSLARNSRFEKNVRRFPSHETEFRPSFNVKPRQMEMNAIERLFERCFVVHGKCT